MTTTTATTTNREFAIKIRCGGRTYTETVWGTNAETMWGHQISIEMQYERDYGYKARVISVKEVK